MWLGAAVLALGCGGPPRPPLSDGGAADAGPAASRGDVPQVTASSPMGRFRFARWDALEATLAGGANWSGPREPKRVTSALAHDLDGAALEQDPAVLGHVLS